MRTSFCVPVWQNVQVSVQPTWEEMQSVPRQPTWRCSRAEGYYHLGATYWHNNKDTMPKHSILGLPGFLARNIPERIVCLMVLMPRWIQWYGLETIEQILRSEP